MQKSRDSNARRRPIDPGTDSDRLTLTRRTALIALFAFFAGLVIGGLAFVNSQPRSFLAVSDCSSTCYRPSDLLGLLASAGIQVAPNWLPGIVRQSDQCVAITHPFPESRFHFVIFPKKDIKDIADVSVEDQAVLMDCIAMIRALVSTYGLSQYKVVTNGPRLQHVRYLHFHLSGK